MWYIAIHRWTGDPREALPMIPTHRAWVLEQENAGKILASGPTPDKSLGIMLFRAESSDEVEKLCESEPLIAAGKRTVEIIPWDVHEIFGIDLLNPREGAPA
jgi:uncharacterized protein YciI